VNTDVRPREVARRPARPGGRIKTDPRFSRRRRAVERAKRRRVIVRAGVAAGLLVLAWTLFFSPLLAVRDIDVSGAEHTQALEVAEAAALGRNTNLLLLDGAGVIERVEELPWVKSARLDRMLPGTVRIRISERRPAMVLSLGAARWTIDATGRVLGAGSAARGLPVLAGVQVGTIEPGLSLRTSEAEDALAAYRGLPRVLRRRVVGVFAPTIERITFALDDQTQIRYGAAEDVAAKNEVLRALLRRLRAEGTTAGYIDVRVPGRPAVTEHPVETPPAAPGE
jgi:cell division protein FtsQ